jgi:hypothetical protein
MNATTLQLRHLHKLLHDTDQMEIKAALVLQFTEGRSSHSSDMYIGECRELIAHLDVTDKQRKRILSVCHQLGWYRRDASGSMVLRNGKGILDYDRIDAWCIRSGAYHKSLNKHTAQELSKLIFQIEAVQKSQLK